MEDVGPTRNAPRQHQDLLHTWSALWLWCLPILILLVASRLSADHRLSFTAAGLLLILASFWIGAACSVNGRGCGRVHCKVDGVVLPLLSIVGLVNVLHVISLSWNTYTSVFTIIIALSFVAEYVDNKLQHQKHGAVG